MPTAVKEAIAFAVETTVDFQRKRQSNMSHAMVKEGRLIEECWS